jgi:hypothetical protein
MNYVGGTFLLQDFVRRIRLGGSTISFDETCPGRAASVAPLELLPEQPLLLRLKHFFLVEEQPLYL